ncbi:MAG: hypothetical protein EGQ10_06485, partial [Clostridiales bacterium]|nr:hypothetical protein [Clostridiales bacterium]
MAVQGVGHGDGVHYRAQHTHGVGVGTLHLIRTVLDGETLTCAIPSFRDDIEGRADLAEEVMRIYGYDHIVPTFLNTASVTNGG